MKVEVELTISKILSFQDDIEALKFIENVDWKEFIKEDDLKHIYEMFYLVHTLLRYLNLYIFLVMKNNPPIAIPLSIFLFYLAMDIFDFKG